MIDLTITPWALPGMCGVLVAAVAGRIAWRSRQHPGARELLVLCAAVGWWCLWQAIVLALTDLPAKLLASKIQYLGITATPVAWLWFALAYTSRARLLSRLGWALVLAPELVTLLLVWTNERHGLMWEGVSLGPDGSAPAILLDYGAWFRVHVFYVYGLVLAATGMLAVLLGQSPHQRRRLAAVVVAPLLPVLGNSIFLLDRDFLSGLDLTPTGLALAGLVLAWSLLRDDLLELRPVPRGELVEVLPEGIVVVDAGGRVVDINAAGARLLRCAPGDRLPGGLLAAIGRIGPADAHTIEVGERVLEVIRSPATELTRGGMAVVVRDVTEQSRLQGELRRVGDELLRANRELMMRANTDELTGLATRRRFLELLEHELRRATRYSHPVGLLLLDIDNFKQINDRLGHAAGDAVLRAVADTIRDAVRQIDLVGRLGGDELAIALPETDEVGARVTAQRLVNAVARRADINVTISVGAVATATGAVETEELIHCADVALYRAKAAGRNRVGVLEPGEMPEDARSTD